MKNENQGTIRNRFKKLLLEKRARDEQKWTYATIQAETGIHPVTLTDWAADRVKTVSLHTLAALCGFLECQPGDLLEYVPPSDAGPK